MSTRGRRRRGATFTIVVLVTSAILLAIGGAFVDSARQVGTLAGLRERQEEAKEALAGGAEWARVALASLPAGRTAEKAVLRFSKASVAVELKVTGDAATAEMAATVVPDTKLTGRAALAKKDGRWVVVRFEIPESR
jgi:hypothetical protein